MKKSVVAFALGIFLSFSFLSASFSLGNSFIETNYGPHDTLKGWVEISLDEEPADSVFESSGGDTATIMTLLKGDGNFNYDCDTSNCKPNYIAGEPTIEPKSFTLDAGKSKIIGLKIQDGNFQGVHSFTLGVKNVIGVSDIPQLKIDIGNDGDIEWQSYKISAESWGEKDFGCYSSGSDSAPIGSSYEWCGGGISLSPSSSVRIGAMVSGTGEATYELSIKKDSNDEGFSCTATASQTGEIGCVPGGFSVSGEGDFFVCIQKISGGGGYFINWESVNPTCGTPSGFDFEVFAQTGKYAGGEEFTLNTAEAESSVGYGNLEGYIDNYIDDEYGGNCAEGCVIPIKFTSAVDGQEITVSNALLEWAQGLGTTNEIYDLAETPAKITADMQQLSIDAGKFGVPKEYGNHTITLEFEGEPVFSKQISVERMPMVLFVTPKTTAVGYPTTFSMGVGSEKEIKAYEWTFGDGEAEITTTNKVEHVYDFVGDYTLNARAIDVNDRSSSKDFTITIKPASEITGTLLEETRMNLDNILFQLEEFSEFEQSAISEKLALDSAQTILESAENSYASATTEEEHEMILQKLLDISIPEKISLTFATDSLLFYPQKEKIDVNALADISGGDYKSSKGEKYALAVVGWMIQNVDVTMTYKGLVSSFDGHSETLLNSFEIDVTKKIGNEEEAYIVLGELAELVFDEDYSMESGSGYFYSPLVGESQKIVFATSEDVNFINLPFFVSPGISYLSVAGIDFSPVDDSGKLKKWVLFSLIILLLLIIGILFWIFLQAWYKKKYEDYLFKNKNNLYNLFMWIEGAKKRGLDEKEIRNQLRKAGWTPEQLRYAMRKHGGKRTGMPEIPINKILQRSKKNVSQGKFPSNSGTNRKF